MSSKIKLFQYMIIPTIALGLVFLSPFGLNYYCDGWQSPIYSGSPFLFKQKSLGSSLTYYYSISGLALNILLWSILLMLINRGLQSLIHALQNKALFQFFYRVIIGGLLLISSFIIIGAYLTTGHGFEKGRNYWYFDRAEDMSHCKGQWHNFGYEWTE